MTWFLAAAVVVTAIAAWTDWRGGVIPNWLTFGAIACAPVAWIALGFLSGSPKNEALTDGCYSILGGFVCALVPLLLYSKNAIGGGDVKLFVAIGALCRPLVGVEAEVYGFFAAALIAPIGLAYEGKLFRTFKNALHLVVNPFLPKNRQHVVQPEVMSWFRMGPAILLGTAFTAYLHWRAPW
jgi:prepilin peptidase CpaA